MVRLRRAFKSRVCIVTRPSRLFRLCAFFSPASLSATALATPRFVFVRLFMILYSPCPYLLPCPTPPRPSQLALPCCTAMATGVAISHITPSLSTTFTYTFRFVRGADTYGAGRGSGGSLNHAAVYACVRSSSSRPAVVQASRAPFLLPFLVCLVFAVLPSRVRATGNISSNIIVLVFHHHSSYADSFSLFFAGWTCPDCSSAFRTLSGVHPALVVVLVTTLAMLLGGWNVLGRAGRRRA